ncbi:MAG: pilus assembly protein [Rhodocyclaceae bacterium]
MNTSIGYHKHIATALLTSAALALTGAVQAAPTDLATMPLITPGVSSVRPNLMFIMDNSGSMDWDYLPDWIYRTGENLCKGTTGTANVRCCRRPDGAAGSWSCLPQDAAGVNLDGSGGPHLRGMPPFHSADFNSNYYNPAITYTAPKNADGTSKTSYSGTGAVPWDGYGVQYNNVTRTINLITEFPDVEWCTDTTHSDCLRADNYVLPGTVNGKSYTTMRAVRATGSSMTFATGSPAAPTTITSNVGPYYYTMVPGEYCTTRKLVTCINAAGPTATHTFPARLRWCNNSAGRVAGEQGASGTDACQAVKNATYKYPRYPTLLLANAVSAASATGKITVSGLPDSGNTTGVDAACNALGAGSKATVSSIRLNGVEILTTAFTYCDGNNNQNTRNNNLAKEIRTRIGNGFSASHSNAELIITTPATATYNGATLTPAPTITTASLAITTTFVNGATAAPALYAAGSFKRLDIVSGQTFGNMCVNASGVVSNASGACPSGSTLVVDRNSRTDCAGRPTCTYAEELANFANWFAWYRSRMQMTKSALSTAFQSVDDRFRVGYFTINSASSNLVNIAPFDTAQKSTWYTKLFDANPDGGTPLRVALAQAGRIYAGKTAITGATDPVQYSCQKNFTILSTDGYWNGSNGVRVDGITPIANEDSTGMVIGGVTGPFADTYSGTLADVAAYYYKTDLRQSVTPFSNCTGALGVSVCANDVPTSTGNKNTAQHMVTYTIGLGIDGVMMYRDNYKTPTTDTTDDYDAVRLGTTASPATGVCPWQTTGACNWPQPAADAQTNIDDLWHAAVNGHGTYYSAKDPLGLSRGLLDVLASIGTDDGGAAAATTSNPNVTTGDNFVFSSKYWTSQWTGELIRQTMDLTSGNINTGQDWAAHTQLDAASWSGRNIYTFSSAHPDKLKPFRWDQLNGVSTSCTPPTNEKGCFSSTYIDSSLAQFCTIGPLCLSSTEKTAASGQNLVDFLRGDRSNEDTTSTTGLYRERKGRLGDIVSSEAVYVGKYLYEYGTSSGYPVKGTSRANPTVFVGANDGMLHAFDAANGNERWAYIPSMVMKDIFRLADKDYATKRRYFVDGTPVAGDVQSGPLTWKTILVGGLAGGGPGYYALDITDTATDTSVLNPKVLWEFRQKPGCTAGTSPRYTTVAGITEDCDLGHGYGNPEIVKLPSGTWVVMVTSGYNNHVTGDGKGYLYILDALTGAVLHKVTTNTGDTTTPSGLARIRSWVDDAMKDNTAKYVYGGDLLGNMWKFDLTSGTPVKSLLINVGSSKPITARPELGEVVMNNGQKKRVVFFSSGKLLGNVDLADTSQQSFYGIWDKDGSPLPTTLIDSTVISGGSGRVGVVQTSVFEDDNNLGWQLNYPEPGERGNTDPQLAFGTLIFVTNKPGSADACNPSGFSSWVYNVDYLSGGVVQQAGDSNTHLATAYAGASTRPNVVVLPSGVVKSITRTSGQDVVNNVEEVRIKSGGSSVRRVTWRELQN